MYSGQFWPIFKVFMRVLLIRLSSFGDILQTLPAVEALASHGATVGYLTKPAFSPLVRNNPNISRVLEMDGKGSVWNLWTTALKIHSLNYTHIYDAHNNLRSLILKFFLFTLSVISPKTKYTFLTRSKNRWKRFLFFKLRRPVFKLPFRGAESFITPLAAWNVHAPPKNKKQLFLKPAGTPPQRESHPWPSTPFVTLAPSAAWPNKRWPIEYWKTLVQSIPKVQFVVLGGPEDSFCEDIRAASPENTINLAGQLSLLESCAAVEESMALVSNDTGLLHAADQMNVRNIALIGPTAFGYPYNDGSVILETQLPCKPCSKDGRDPCVNAVYQKCMKEISPNSVTSALQRILGERFG